MFFGHDTTESENPADCITVLLTVFKLVDERVKSLIVCIAGAVPGVENCFEQNDQTTLNITTLWIYNKELRQRIEAEWKTKKEMAVSLPHMASTSPDLKEFFLPNNNSVENFISFTLDIITVKYFPPDESHTKERRWIVEVLPGDAASGGSPTLASKSPGNPEVAHLG